MHGPRLALPPGRKLPLPVPLSSIFSTAGVAGRLSGTRWPWLLSGLVAALIFVTIFGPGLSIAPPPHLPPPAPSTTGRSSLSLLLSSLEVARSPAGVVHSPFGVAQSTLEAKESPTRLQRSPALAIGSPQSSVVSPVRLHHSSTRANDSPAGLPHSPGGANIALRAAEEPIRCMATPTPTFHVATTNADLAFACTA